MGKKLIIKGADFSVNGIVPPATRIKGVTTAIERQIVHLIVPDNLTTANTSYKLKYYVTSVEKTQDMGIFHTGLTYQGFRNAVVVGYTDGRHAIYCNGKRMSYTFIPAINYMNDIFAKQEEVVLNGVSYNTIGNIRTAEPLEGYMTIFPYDENYMPYYPAGHLIISEVSLYDSSGTTLYAHYVSALDRNNKACFWDILSDTLCYANEGDLVAIMD